MEKQQPIGIFDSGIGGLSICQAVKHLLPQEDLIYFADTEFSPYGPLSHDIIVDRAACVTEFLIRRGSKAIVIACNTATVHAIAVLREHFSVPIIGVEPAVKPAALLSKSGIIAVLATEQTLASRSYRRLTARYGQGVRIESCACPEFVTLVEGLRCKSREAYVAAENYVRPLLQSGCDKIVLGCTHFSFLRTALERAVGADADLLDTATPVAMQLKKRLQELDLLRTNCQHGGAEFWTSGDIDHAEKSISFLWGQETTNVQRAD